ncbi:argonaute-like protein [Mycena filopes]|nr:argonaute-like protein [Mycena filopes]
MRELQNTVSPDLFQHHRVVYDGDKKLYALVELDLSDGGRFIVTLDTMAYAIHITRNKSTIDTSVLLDFAKGARSHDASVARTKQALNVAMRMAPLSNSSLSADKNRTKFYTPDDIKALSLGVVLWRGYFSTLRAGIDRLFVNIDVATGAMYRPGSLIELACEHLRQTNVRDLITLLHVSESERLRLARFIDGLHVQWRRIGSQQDVISRAVSGITAKGADHETFIPRGGDAPSISIARYFRDTSNRTLQYPGLNCIEVGNADAGRKRVLVPFELCSVPAGQRLRVDIPAELIVARNQWSTRPPSERLNNIKKGSAVLGYQRSNYIRDFGIAVDPSVLSTTSRVLPPLGLKYVSALDRREESIVYAQNGHWNIRERHFYKSATMKSWALLTYEPAETFTRAIASTMTEFFVNGCRDAGITVVRQTPSAFVYLDRRRDISKQLDAAERQCVQRDKHPPSLFLVVNPDKDGDTYTAVKHWGDVKRGIATQCLTRRYAISTKRDLWTNVAHKINVKLGGINVVVDPTSVPLLGDPKDVTMIMGVQLHPWHTGVVASLDAHAAKYAARSHPQRLWTEIIDDLDKMTSSLLAAHMRYRRENEGGGEYEVPQRIIFYRDGVPEEQFQEILDTELPLIKKGCETLNVFPKISIILVAKRHHIRFFDNERKCEAGTVVDRQVGHPTESDFYLQAHGQFGERGTLRPAHYHVLYDENNLSADQIQSLSFALCHLYGRSSSAVSIPAPVYYADRVCARMANHLDPESLPRKNYDAPRKPTPAEFDDFSGAYKATHENQRDEMYFI